MSSKQVIISIYILTFVLRNVGIQIVYLLYLSISSSGGESCTGSLGYSVAAMATPPEICGSSFVGKKHTAYRCLGCKEEPNEEEEPRKRIREETITKSSAPSGTVSMFKMLPQTDNQCSKVDVKHGEKISAQYVTYMQRIEMIATSPLATGGVTIGMEVTRNRLQTRSPLLI